MIGECTCTILFYVKQKSKYYTQDKFDDNRWNRFFTALFFGKKFIQKQLDETVIKKCCRKNPGVYCIHRLNYGIS